MMTRLADEAITKVELAFMLRFWTEGHWQVNLEGVVTVVPDDGQATEVHHDVVTAELPEQLHWLIGARIVGVEVTPGGDLIVKFGDRSLTCVADADYESWQVYGPRGEIIVCGPGGKLTEWGPRGD